MLILKRALAGCLGVLCAAIANGQESIQASLKGRVFAYPSNRPIPDADVTIDAIGKKAKSDANGAFAIDGIAPGTYMVHIRRIGFAFFEATISFVGGQTVEKGVELPVLSSLDSVRVVGDRGLPLSFLENRAAGLGKFMTRTELDRYGQAKLAGVISTLPGVGVAYGRANGAWPLSKRVVPRIRRPGASEPGNDFYVPDAPERALGMAPGCYARVYVDGVLQNPSTPAEPVNVNQFSADRVEAIEWYAGAGSVPSRYGRLNTTCGVLVIHTRR